MSGWMLGGSDRGTAAARLTVRLRMSVAQSARMSSVCRDELEDGIMSEVGSSR